MTQKEIICVGCPLGCHVLLSLDPTGNITDCAGNECKQGKKFAKEEYENPVRVFTSTVLTKGSVRPLLPVRTSSAVLKEKLKECAFFISKITVQPPLAMGDVIVPNLLGTGADLICSSDLKGRA